MKKTLIGLALLAGAYAVHAQGSVSFNNYLTGGPYVYVTYKPTGVNLGGGSTGPAPTLQNFASEVGNGSDWSVQLYGITGTGTPVPLAGGTVTMGATPSTAGVWTDASPVLVPGAVNGTLCTLQVYAWYNDGGTIGSYGLASADGVPVGFSAVTTVNAGAPPGTPPGFQTFAAGLGNFSVAAPEPSTIALGVIGASTFLLRLRRKS